MSGKSVGRLTQMFRDIRHTLNIRKHGRSAPKVLVGTDEYGNKYFKQQGDAAKSIKAKRWVEALHPDQSRVPRVPIHWDAWLRGRKEEPPSEEEVARTAERVARGKGMSTQTQDTSLTEQTEEEQLFRETKTPFPKYDDLHLQPKKRPKPD